MKQKKHFPHSNITKAKAVVFDIDGTLYSNIMMLLRSPLSYTRSFLWIMHYYKMRQKLRKAFVQNGDCSIENVIKNKSMLSNMFWKHSVELFSQEIHVSIDEANILLKRCVYDMWIHAVKNVVLRSGMRTLLGDLYRKKVPLGIVSDFSAQEKIDQWNLNSYFSSILCTEDFAALKPDPTVFLMSCKEMNCKPEQTIYVGNSVRYDGLGAKAAGLIPVLFHNKKKHVETWYQVATVKNVAQLRSFLSAYKI